MLYGVFAFREDGIYRAGSAIKVYKSQKLAEREASRLTDSQELAAVCYSPRGFVARRVDKSDVIAASKEAGADGCKQYVRSRKASAARRDRDEAYAACGLTKVRGAHGGFFYE